jgi:hypothetical protein
MPWDVDVVVEERLLLVRTEVELEEVLVEPAGGLARRSPIPPAIATTTTTAIASTAFDMPPLCPLRHVWSDNLICPQSKLSLLKIEFGGSGMDRSGSSL